MPKMGMVRVGRVELPSQPWEGYIIAAIRHPRISFFRLTHSMFICERVLLEPPRGFEPRTSALRKRRSSQLS
jgi:hypothetical protein